MSFGAVAMGLGAAASVKSLTSGGGGGGGSTTASKEPWEEAAPWLKDNIKKGQELQAAYEAQPFNQLQQTAYQQTFGDIDNYRQNLMPALMQYATKGLPGFNLPASYSTAAMQSGNPAGFMTVSPGQQGGAQGQGQAGARFSQTPEQAAVTGQWLAANIDNPALIQQHARQYGMTNADLLTAAQTANPNITTAQVDQFMGRQDPQYARPAFGLIDWGTIAPRRPAPAAPAPAPAQESFEEWRKRQDDEKMAQYREMERGQAGM